MELKEAVENVVSQDVDNICWLDVLKDLAKVVGKEFNPLLLPKEKFLANCQRYANSLYENLPYDKDEVTKTIEEGAAEAILNSPGRRGS